MIHIVRTETGFEVATVADNGELLSASEVLSSKQKCWTNIFSHYRVWDSAYVYVQDDTLKKAMVYGIYKSETGQRRKVAFPDLKTESRYIPSSSKPKYQPKKK